MIWSGKFRLATSAGGVIGSLAVAVALYVGLSVGPDIPTIGDPGPATEAPLVLDGGAVDLAIKMPSAMEYVEIVRRPIFSPNRRPVAEGETTLQTVAFELNLKLIGIIISAGQPIAIVAPNNSSEFVRLTEGDSYQGWIVAGIEPQRVTLRRDAAVEYLELNYDQPPAKKAPVPNAREAQQAQQQEEAKEKQ